VERINCEVLTALSAVCSLLKHVVESVSGWLVKCCIGIYCAASCTVCTVGVKCCYLQWMNIRNKLP